MKVLLLDQLGTRDPVPVRQGQFYREAEAPTLIGPALDGADGGEPFACRASHAEG